MNVGEARPIRFSVIMPTFERTDVLERTLRAYLALAPMDETEILVVDDGSSGATATLLATITASSGGRMRTWRQVNAGPGAARNRALREARGEFVLFAGDDVIPAPGLLEAHAAAHARWGGAVDGARAEIAVLGRIRWHADLLVTPFMRWLEESGTQFAFGRVASGDLLPPTMFYTSNLSIRRAVLPPQPVFDERFRHACWEDVDLGMRLARAGVRLRFAPEAEAWHWHPTDLALARERAERVGYYRALLEKKHGIRPPRRRAWSERLKRALAPLLRSIPVEGVRGLGFRWSLAWQDFLGEERFRASLPKRSSAPRGAGG